MADAFSAVDLRFSFGGQALIDGVGFGVPQGGLFVITGRSGSGKSTLLELCSGQHAPESGRVLWDGACIADLNHDELVRAKQRIGYVFQKPALVHNFTIYDNLALPLRYHRDLAERDIRATVHACMEEMGLFNVDAKYPNELSAAQSRCAAIARALVMGPSLLFLDEPTSGVDPVTARGIAGVLKGLNASRGIAMVVVCTSIEFLKGLQCPVTVLQDGKLHDYRDPAVVSAGAGDMFSLLREAL
ncbi:MAG TPA: ATP-binding cassette domain-containing protein [Chitinivibrionales bacterium]|nr:ATP-binding cassette domain-containing protein [Chitinivibrionales bacterium]